MKSIKNLLLLVLLLNAVGCSEYMNDPQSEKKINSQNGVNTSISETYNSTTVVSAQSYVLDGITPCGIKVADLWAGQTIDAGSVTIYNDNTNLYVTVFSTDGYITGTEQLKMWVGTDLLNMPQNKQGIPIPGQFPYKITTDGNTTYTFTIPLNSLALINNCGQPVYVVVHADVLADNGSGTISSETAFGGDVAGTGPRWWYYSNYTIECCSTPPVFDRSETAFAKGGYVFTTDKKSNPENLPSLNLTKNRWGWAINIKKDGVTTYDIWAGAGLNKTSSGIHVGTLTITKLGNSISVTYSLFSGKVMQESHIYVGDYKPTTLAPGQYGETSYFDPLVSRNTTSFEVSDTDGDGIWVIAHAVVNF